MLSDCALVIGYTELEHGYRFVTEPQWYVGSYNQKTFKGRYPDQDLAYRESVEYIGIRELADQRTEPH